MSSYLYEHKKKYYLCKFVFIVLKSTIQSLECYFNLTTFSIVDETKLGQYLMLGSLILCTINDRTAQLHYLELHSCTTV